MRQIATDITIEAAPAEVWAVLTDLDGYPEWNPFIQEASGNVAVGETLTLKMFPTKGRPLTIRPKVLTADEGTELRWKGKLLIPGIFDGEHRFELRPTEAGTTQLVQSEGFSGLLVPLLGKAIERTKDSFEALNQALKSRVESGTGT